MTPTNDDKPGKKARRKVTTDLGRQLLTRERQRLSREQAALAEQQLKEAEIRRTQQRRNTVSAKPIDVAVNRSLVRKAAGVLASEGVSVRIVATPARTTSAWTDFTQIVVNYAQQDDERVLAATLRALIYHEGGHCRFTLPFTDLATAAGVNDPERKLHRAWNCLEDMRMETAIVSDSPRKAAYLTPMVLLDIAPTADDARQNWPILIWRRYLPKHIRVGARKLFVQHHNDEGLDGEALATAMEHCATKYVLASDPIVMWDAVVEFHGLLSQAAAMGVNADDLGHSRQYRRGEGKPDMNIPIDDSMIDDEGDGSPAEGDGSEGEGDKPGESKSGKGKGKGKGSKDGKSKGSKPVIDKPMTDDEDGDEDGDDGEGGSFTTGDGKDDRGDDEGKKFANDKVDDVSPVGGSHGAHKNVGVRDDLDYGPTEELTDDDLQAAIEEAEAERNADPSLSSDVLDLHNALNTQTSDLQPYIAGVSTDGEAKAAADVLADGIEQAFIESTVERAPGWAEGQRRGFVNVLRYETRRAGDVEFFRSWTEMDAPGRNIAVSVLLDYSGSMGGATKELAQTGYACKVACQKLDIPCTVVLWDTSATVLFDATEHVEHLPVIVSVGGTDPTVALADLDRQRFDKDIHLVIIMTDGAWSGASAQAGYIASFKGDTPGRYFIGLGYNSWEGSSDSLATNLRRYGCDEAHGVDSLLAIPRYLEDALIAFA